MISAKEARAISDIVIKKREEEENKNTLEFIEKIDNLIKTAAKDGREAIRINFGKEINRGMLISYLSELDYQLHGSYNSLEIYW